MQPEEWSKIKSVFNQIVDLSETEQEKVLADYDESLRFEVGELLKSHQKAENFIAEPVIVKIDLDKDSFVGKQIDNYKLLEKIGTGGMGNVYLAERLNSDFKQKIALKLIKLGMDSEAILKRFAIERRILSRLKHPNIAELLDGGISSQGQPYFVMEFVEGETLTEFCRNSNLDLEKRLEIFRQICSAVEYAHRNLIIHRDLKPSNILVTKDGIPKLLDFGIAKLLADEETEITVTQHKMFTPEYASPEQVLGNPVTTSTDIYSLGVILYEILSGERPYQMKGKSYEEIIKIVCDSPVTKPSEAITKANLYDTQEQNVFSKEAKIISGDLDNITLKSLRKEPTERYGTVQQLIEDIERYLKGLPVLARPQTLKYRFSKYIKRHKLGTLAAALVLLSLVGGISVATWQAHIAQQEREKAEQRFNDVRNLSKSVIFDIHNSIAELPGSTAARELLVNKSLEYLDKLALEAQEDTSLQMELAEGYDQIAGIQGGYTHNHLGQREKALESYQKALAIKEKLVALEPNNAKFQQQLGASYFNIGNMYLVEAKSQESVNMFRKSVEVFEQLSKENPDDESFKYSVGKSTMQLSQSLIQIGEADESFQNAQKSVEIWEELVKKTSDLSNRQSLLASLNNLGDFFLQKKDYQEALKIYQRSFEISKELLAEEPNNTSNQRNVGASYARFSDIHFEKEEYQLSLDNSRIALEIFQKILNSDPNNEEAKTIVASLERWISKILIKMGRGIEVIPNLQKSLASLEKQYADSPMDKLVYFQIGEAKLQLGYAYKTLAEKTKSPEDKRKSCDYFQTTYKMYQEFVDLGYGDSAFNEREIKQLTDEAQKCGS